MTTRQLQYFALLGPEEQRRAIQRLAASRVSDHTIAATTGLSVDQVRRVLSADPPPSAPPLHAGEAR